METDGMEETPQSSLQVWLNANTSIHEFKTSMVSVFDKDLKEVEKYYEEQMRLYRQQQERMAEQQNSQTQQMNQYTIPMNNPNINNPLVQKQNYLLRVKDNKTGAMINRTQGELIGKAIKKSGASVNSNTAGTQVSGSGNSSGGNSGPQTNGPLIPLNGYSSIGFGTSATGAGSDGSATNNITPEHVYSLLLTNVIITGGTSLIDGMEQRIRFPQYKLSTFTNPDQLQRSLQAWNGAVSLSNLPKWGLTQWFTKEDFNNHKLKKDNNNVSQ
ncbi:Actin [Nakaseomyces glabratus]